MHTWRCLETPESTPLILLSTNCHVSAPPRSNSLHVCVGPNEKYMIAQYQVINTSDKKCVDDYSPALSTFLTHDSKDIYRFRPSVRIRESSYSVKEKKRKKKLLSYFLEQNEKKFH